ncbi:MAG TPA: hypothetical protein PKC44_16300 [Agitococcus sp.]|nr:hypothetical protein [Agitococcus sp.]
MQVLGWEDVIISGISFAGVSYNQDRLKANRKIIGQVLVPTISFRNQRLPVPQTFLNEARLSALALAIYLAGRLVSVPTDTAGQLKLLVLDDVLVGLDHANRIPVLDVLKQYFSDWQIVLLTHDRLWFEITRARANIEGDNWEVLELYANHEEDANYRPTLRASHRDVVEAYLQTAEQHLNANPPDYRASAVYARSAFEMWLKLQCDKLSIPIRFSFEPRKLDANVYFNALEGWESENYTKPAFSGVLKILALYRDTVFNPASHSYPTTMNGMELKMAIRAMRFINEATKGNSTLKLAEHLLNKANPSQEEIVLAAAFVRSMFVRRLREFAEGKLMPFSIKPHKTSMTALWSMMADKWPPKRATWVANINLNQAILIDTWTWTFLQTVTVTQVRNALQAIQQH